MVELVFGNGVFRGEGKPGVREKNLSEQKKEPTTNSTHRFNPQVASASGFEPGPLWWEAIVPTAVTPDLGTVISFLGHSINKHYKNVYMLQILEDSLFTVVDYTCIPISL